MKVVFVVIRDKGKAAYSKKKNTSTQRKINQVIL